MTTNHTPTADYPGSGEHVEILLRQRAELIAALREIVKASLGGYSTIRTAAIARAALAKVSP